MLFDLFIGGVVSLLNFGIHAVMTALIVVTDAPHRGAHQSSRHLSSHHRTAHHRGRDPDVRPCGRDRRVGRLARNSWHQDHQHRNVRIRIRELHRARLRRRVAGRRKASFGWADHGAQRPPADRMVGGGHLRGDAHGRIPDRQRQALPIEPCTGSAILRSTRRLCWAQLSYFSCAVRIRGVPIDLARARRAAASVHRRRRPPRASSAGRVADPQRDRRAVSHQCTGLEQRGWRLRAREGRGGSPYCCGRRQLCRGIGGRLQR